MESQIKVWIFIPIYNFEPFLKECFDSIYIQTYKNYHCLVINDGSTDMSQAIIEEQQNRFSNFTIIKNNENNGGGYTKWQALTYVKKNGSINDIFIILDGDDYYKKPESLSVIVKTYWETNCLFTYGSFEGTYSEQTIEVPIPYKHSPDIFPFGHPRSWHCALLTNFVCSDFKDRNNNWLKRYTDRRFIYKSYELAGPDRTAYIKDVLYVYRTHSNNCRKIHNSPMLKTIAFDYITHLPICPVLNEDIHIVMCQYKRVEYLSTILRNIQAQTIANRIVVHIVNNNIDKWEDIKSLVKSIDISPVRFTLCNTGNNYYGYARFLRVKQLLKTTFLPYVIFIDDDQAIPPTWVEHMYKLKKPMTYSAWYGRIFESSKPLYWNSIITHTAITKNINSATIYDYAGTGGCIIDTRVFMTDILFRCPKKYRFVEDLWLSFLFKKIFKTSLIRTFLPLLDMEGTASTGLYTTIRSEKEEFFKLLLAQNYLSDEPPSDLESLYDYDDSNEIINTFNIDTSI
jgi:glycosyltransferase involved in cell wall biosynthesis